MPVWGRQATECGAHGLATRCSGGTNDGSSCITSADGPGGMCAPVGGVCEGGDNPNALCFSVADCTGTCGPKTTGQCIGGLIGGTQQQCQADKDCGPYSQCVPSGFCLGSGLLCQSDANC